MTKNVEIDGEQYVVRDREGFPMNREIAPDNTEKMAMITDDNDDLQYTPGEDQNWSEDEHKEEWTKTPGGFCKIDLDLDDEVRTDLINFWARDNLNEASLETYEDLRKSGSQEDALYGAVLNDVIIQTLTEQIARTEAENDKSEA
jgi:hypothetical protein